MQQRKQQPSSDKELCECFHLPPSSSAPPLLLLRSLSGPLFLQCAMSSASLTSLCLLSPSRLHTFVLSLSFLVSLFLSGKMANGLPVVCAAKYSFHLVTLTHRRIHPCTPSHSHSVSQTPSKYSFCHLRPIKLESLSLATRSDLLTNHNLLEANSIKTQLQKQFG